MHYVLWSGGFDSTYLLCKRAREEATVIQPVYEVFPRYNTTNERKHRLELLNLIRAKKDIKGTIRDPIEIAKEALPISEEYDAAYERKKDIVGPMYASLGKMALLFPGCEIGIEAPAPGFRPNDIGQIEQCMIDHGLKLDDNGNVTPGVGDPDILLLYGGFSFPILHINAAQELADFKTWGYDDVIKKTWTCTCALDRQCGVCHNCEVKWRYGDTFRWMFNERAQKDHDIKLWLEGKDKKENTGYADAFTQYVMNGDWYSEESEDRESKEERQQRSENLMAYFSYLENNWPNVEDINAPAL